MPVECRGHKKPADLFHVGVEERWQVGSETMVDRHADQPTGLYSRDYLLCHIQLWIQGTYKMIYVNVICKG